MSKATAQPMSLKIASGMFLAFWCLLAAFPIVWIAIMSVKSPRDAFAASAWDVITGPATRAAGNGLSILDLVLGLAFLIFAIRWAFAGLPRMIARFSPPGLIVLGWIVGALLFALGFIVIFFGVLPPVFDALNSFAGPLGTPVIGLTTEHYVSVWGENEFYRNFMNSMIVTAGVVTISLTVGTLAGYGLARSGSNLAFWLLILALIFRALPHSVLVAGYLPWFINSAELLRPIFGELSPTLYGQPWAVIAVLVAINQPFTIWMLRSFFQNIPSELDEAARVDGCSHFQAFRRVIMPVMWPGVITTGTSS
jgi:trehalose/maltose transport system permease protein